MRKRAICVSLALMCLMFISVSASAQTSRKSVSAAEVNGTYRMNFRGKFRKMSNELKILALGNNKLRVAFDLIYPYTLRNGEISVNMGGLDTTGTIIGDVANIYPEGLQQCDITIKFVRPGTIKVTQDGTDADCGFGHNVTSDGTYLKVSSRKPKFEPID
ncbi:MAG: hypothetical protein IPM59_04360 [Chloracidobacterium sp.]|nr:hypothetical protein [Chloracidobacterium sp.]